MIAMKPRSTARRIQRTIASIGLGAALSLPGLAQDEPEAAEAVVEPAAKRGWTLSVSAVHRSDMKLRSTGHSYAGMGRANDLIPGRNGIRIDRNRIKAPTDDITEVKDRVFHDGFVSVGTLTEVPGPFQNIATWNWGYLNASQYDAGSDSLTFSRVGTRDVSGVRHKTSARTVRDEISEEETGLDSSGAGITATYALLSGPSGQIEVAVGAFGLVAEPQKLTSKPWALQVEEETYAFRSSQEFEETLVYSDDYGVLPAIAPGHMGTYNGPGPVFRVLPSSRTLRSDDIIDEQGALVDRRIWDLYNEVEIEVDVEQFGFWAGLQLRSKPVKGVTVYLNPRLTAHVVNLSAERVERVEQTAGRARERRRTIATWRDRKDRTTTVFGAGVFAGIDVELKEDWFIGLEAGGDWLFDDPDIKVGPDRVTADLSGLQVGVKVGKGF
ncbi:MAG: hypothetical protein AAF492_16750 [Verrucomicrobiota bacterium]